MLGTLPPYALAAPTFRFPALATLAGRKPLGGERELVLAIYVGAHLTAGLLPPLALPTAQRAQRVPGAKSWLGALAVPAAARPIMLRLIESTARDDRAAIRSALRAAIESAGKLLDAPSRRELERLADELRGE